MSNRIFQVGLTGGIGSGKSTVANLFRLMEAPVYQADSRAKQVISTNTQLKAAIQKTFGFDAYHRNGSVNRQVLADRAFADQNAIDQLNELVHPAVRKDYEQWLQQQKSPYVIHEAALIFEAGLEGHFDVIISVSAPEDLRLARVEQRDGLSQKAIQNRMSRQYSQTYKDQCSYEVILNDNHHLLIPTVSRLHHQWQQLALSLTD